MVRRLTKDDLGNVVDLAILASHRLGADREAFYRTDEHFGSVLADRFERALSSPDAIALVYDSPSGIEGLMVGMCIPAPPVYNPGGKVALIDQFYVVEPDLWEKVGPELLKEASVDVHGRGAIIFCAETRKVDRAKLHFLSHSGFAAASDWCYRRIDGFVEATQTGDTVNESDVPQIVELAERFRLKLEEYQPIFWKKASDSASRQVDYLRDSIGKKRLQMIVRRRGAELLGAISFEVRKAASPYSDRGDWSATDDFVIGEHENWSETGRVLLEEAIFASRQAGATFHQVICPHLAQEKADLLHKMGYTVGHQWLVRPIDQ